MKIALIENHSSYYWGWTELFVTAGKSNREVIESKNFVDAIKRILLGIDQSEVPDDVWEGTAHDTTSYLDRSTFHVYDVSSLSEAWLNDWADISYAVHGPNAKDEKAIEKIESLKFLGTYHCNK